MTGYCIIVLVGVIAALLATLWGVMAKLDRLSRMLDEYKETGDHLKKFSKNLEALFSVDKQKKGGQR